MLLKVAATMTAVRIVILHLLLSLASLVVSQTGRAIASRPNTPTPAERELDALSWDKIYGR